MGEIYEVQLTAFDIDMQINIHNNGLEISLVDAIKHDPKEPNGRFEMSCFSSNNIYGGRRIVNNNAVFTDNTEHSIPQSEIDKNPNLVQNPF